ncbi:hypothetical protein PUN28_003272 [Cardiocondyla obscurior]|uniref:Uncharacterized protein n=1 Tax=Cardiocondyla obscurior TaxID=286306 RepID=A0AAW2GLF1_9HYME
MDLKKWLNNNLSAADYSYYGRGSRAANGRKESAERARWTDKLMGRYGSEESRKDKEEKDPPFWNGGRLLLALVQFRTSRCRKEKDECREKCNNKWASGGSRSNMTFAIERNGVTKKYYAR